MINSKSFLCIVLLCLSMRVVSAQSVNRIVFENTRAGSDDWKLSAPARGEIEGYASRTSVRPGEVIDFYVSTGAGKYSIEIFRMGWYGGKGARRVQSKVERTGILQSKPAPDPVTGLIACTWSDPFSVTVPKAEHERWTSGYFLARLTAIPSGKQSFIPFVVRDDDHKAALLFQASVTTWQAYNTWGGKSLYAGSPQARKVSFDRPYVEGSGAGQFLSWEYNMVRFVEREGFDVTYVTNLDTHTDGLLLTGFKGFLSVGHDEYWSRAMRNAVSKAISMGVHAGFFSGNNCYWLVRFEPSASGALNRTMVSYKEAAFSDDPYARDSDRSNDNEVTTKWRSAPVNEPEDALIGVMYESGNFGIDGDIVVENTNHWIFTGSGLKPGDALPGLLGYEVDRMFGNAPPNILRLAHSPFLKDGAPRFSDMTIYEAESKALVFATGSIQWSWGIDSFAPPSKSRRNAAAEQMTRNVLHKFQGTIAPTIRKRIPRR